MIKKIKNKKIGLVLGSGGSKGLAHIGVIKALKKKNINIDYIAGSSIGALISAYFAMNNDINKLEKIFLQHDWKTGLSIIDPSFNGGLVKGEKLEKLVKEIIGDFKFNETKIPLAITATDLITGNGIVFKDGDIIKAVRASMSVPIIFQPIEYKNKLLADGGLSNPLPVDVIKSMGANFVIAVNLDNQFFDSNDLNLKKKSLPKISIRSLNILRHHLSQYNFKKADIAIEPNVGEIGLVGWNKFIDNKQAKEIIKIGENVTNAILKKYDKN